VFPETHLTRLGERLPACYLSLRCIVSLGREVPGETLYSLDLVLAVGVVVRVEAHLCKISECAGDCVKLNAKSVR
jgi:hypothetical protein